MSHRRGKDAVRMAVIAAKQCELVPRKVPQDFADTEQSDELPELAGWDWPMPEPSRINSLDGHQGIDSNQK